jgi:GT2 family glycosyltransferase
MNPPQLDISIIIINWNTKELLLGCLESIEKEDSRCEIEVIVVDNGSKDGSVEAVRDNYPRVKMIQNGQNLGFAKANNTGIAASTGRYVCLVNSDVKVLPGCFKALIGYMDKNQSIGIMGPKILWPDMSLQDSCRRLPTLWNNLCEILYLNKIFPKSELFGGEHMIFFPHDRIIKVDGLVGCFLVIRRSALDDVGLFDERFFIYSEEIDLCKRFRESGREIVFYPDAQAIHYGRASSSQDPSRFSFEQHRSRLQYWQKHSGGVSRITFVFLMIIRHAVKICYDIIRYLFEPSKRTEIGSQLAKDARCIHLFLQHV